jgi:hypothetical protein
MLLKTKGENFSSFADATMCMKIKQLMRAMPDVDDKKAT